MAVGSDVVGVTRSHDRAHKIQEIRPVANTTSAKDHDHRVPKRDQTLTHSHPGGFFSEHSRPVLAPPVMLLAGMIAHFCFCWDELAK
mmetsp:Transcript_7879/g.18232  ORF Transcript_7879/g.18232 Transcript_7879/m.18232 type:complete len:87 (+) Transcript_7879:70-330(+)